MFSTTPKFARDARALDDLLEGANQIACPHCHRAGMVVGHGWLRGYAENSSEREVRGRRFLCSARLRRTGCGRTFSVWLATTLVRFTVRTQTLSALLSAVVAGESRKSAWERLSPGLCLRSAYRLWARLFAAQSHLRTALCSLTQPPATSDPRLIAQLLAHLRRAVTPAAGCVLAGFQLALHRGVFG